MSAKSEGHPVQFQTAKFLPVPCCHFGQPASQTHPHLLKEGEVTPGITKVEYQLRRRLLLQHAIQQMQEVAQKINNHILIFPSASVVYMTYDIPYSFRQNTEFLYLCGFQEPNSVLVVYNDCVKGKSSDGVGKSALFVPRKNPAKELWDGPSSGTEGAMLLTGVDETYKVDQLELFLYEYRKSHTKFVLWYNCVKPVLPYLHETVLSRFVKESKNCHTEMPNRLVQKLRLIKSDAEIYLMKKSIDIASEAFIGVMKMSSPQVNEAHLYAKMDFECRINGAECLAYPPVVAGGNRANIIHYINNNQIVQEGELVLMDAGCEYHGYASDITRTWPVSGKFTPAQKILYEAVLSIQEMCLQMCTPEFSLDEIYTHMLVMLGKKLQDLNIVPTNLDRAQLLAVAHQFCPHHIGHYLGMDVHDTSEMSRSIKLEAGMVITIEPGLYISNSNTSVPNDFRGVGIRIEDDVLITGSSPVIMSDKCPKTVDDVEAVMEN